MTAAKKGNPAKKVPAKRGTRTKYNPDYHPLAAWTLAIKGLINKEIAAKLRISTGTLAEWNKIHPDFLSAIKDGKGIANTKVEQALFKRATGFRYKEKKKIVSTTGEPRTETTTKHVVPDVSACIFWLKNRASEDWKDKQEMEHTGNIFLLFDKEDKNL